MKVGDLISALSTLDPNLEIVILDADTNWFLNIKEIVDETGYVTIGGVYGDEFYPTQNSDGNRGGG